ncbi:TPA: hypothetical protein HA244_04195 [Candidatus Micrarchaeota archaeon]|nr:hypothetical protein [Candidatus Micrarchaeota archaeon]
MARELGKKLVGLARIHVPNPPLLAQKSLAELKRLMKHGEPTQFDVIPKKRFERRTIGKHELPNSDEKEITTSIEFFHEPTRGEYSRTEEVEKVKRFKEVLREAKKRGFIVHEYGGPSPHDEFLKVTMHGAHLLQGDAKKQAWTDFLQGIREKILEGRPRRRKPARK